MTISELKSARIKMGLNKSEMAKQLRTPYRTYQDWESGERRIPGVCEVAVELLLIKDKWLTQKIIEKASREV